TYITTTHPQHKYESPTKYPQNNFLLENQKLREREIKERNRAVKYNKNQRPSFTCSIASYFQRIIKEMGEEKKEEEKKKEEGEGKKKEEEKKEEEKKDEEKKEEAPPPPPPEIVLKVDMHCEACARKVARALKGFEGVEEVRADSKTSKVVVKGKTADPLKVWERLQKKSGRKVELISPLPKPPEEEAKQEEQQQQPPPPKEEPKEPEKKDEPPPVVTVVLSIRMHCEACAQVIQKRIRKISGVETVETDIVNGTVTVKGVVEPEKLAQLVYKKTKKQVSVVNKEEEKKEEGEEEKKKKEEEEEKKKKEEEEKKKEESEGQQVGKTEEELLQNDHGIKRSEYWPSRNHYSELYAYPPPQMFSDENPNACSVM
ncbi:Heavy metal-associated isoprenylated plant protein 8, partial [Linum perenne]